jgi:agmatine deiminase
MQMKKMFISACIFIALTTGCLSIPLKKPEIKTRKTQQKQPSSSIFFSGEFDKQQAIWMMWPSDVYESGNHPVSPVIINTAKSLAPYIKVNLMLQNKEQIPQVNNLLKNSGYSGSNIYYYIINHMSIWARDVGPIFIKNSSNTLTVVNFGFNNYSRGGNYEYINTEGQVDKITAGLLGLPVINSTLISEGGAIESNGRGTLMVTELPDTSKLN